MRSSLMLAAAALCCFVQLTGAPTPALAQTKPVTLTPKKDRTDAPPAKPAPPADKKQPADAKQPAAAPQKKYAVKLEEKVPVPMPDGVKLAAKIYRPDAPGKFPALLMLRYWQAGDEEAQHFAPLGYACVLVDSRGRGASQGKWELYVNEGPDGYQVHRWLGVQPWCNGKIGTMGQSYNAFTQLMPTVYGSPYIKCLFPIEGQQSNFGHVYNDGILQLNMVFSSGLYVTGPTAIGPHFAIDSEHYRRLPLLKVVDEYPKAATYVKNWFKHDKLDDYWKSYGLMGKYNKFKVPAYFVTGWYDNLLYENLKNFHGFRTQGGSPEAREKTKILIGPWVHGEAGQQYELRERWYDHWLRGVQNGVDAVPPIKIYVMGADVWRNEYEWPLARTRYTKYYLASDGNAQSVEGNGRLVTEAPAKAKPDRFVYDPANPVMTLGGQISTNPEVWGRKDRASTQRRKDVLVYTSEPLAADTEVTGPIEVQLYAASSAVDTDFTATLTDVHPDGRAIHICEGIRGARFRDSLENPTPIEPQKVYRYTINLWATSNLFKQGHRIRLEIASSNFPRYARNQNTGLPLGTSAEIKKAEQTIYHDREHPSCVVLPIIPQEN